MLGLKKNVSSIGLRGELGWRSIKREIQMRKLIFWYRINKKTQESWVKQAAMEIIRKEDNTMIKDIKSIQKEWNKILPSFQSGNETEIKRSWKKIERITWLSENGLSNSLKHYPKDEISREEIQNT